MSVSFNEEVQVFGETSSSPLSPIANGEALTPLEMKANLVAAQVDISNSSISSSLVNDVKVLSDNSIIDDLYQAFFENDQTKIFELLTLCKTRAQEGSPVTLEKFFFLCFSTQNISDEFDPSAIISTLKKTVDKTTYMKASFKAIVTYYRSDKWDRDESKIMKDAFDFFMKDQLSTVNLFDIAITDSELCEDLTSLLKTKMNFTFDLKKHLSTKLGRFTEVALKTILSNVSNENLLGLISELDKSKASKFKSTHLKVDKASLQAQFKAMDAESAAASSLPEAPLTETSQTSVPAARAQDVALEPMDASFLNGEYSRLSHVTAPHFSDWKFASKFSNIELTQENVVKANYGNDANGNPIQYPIHANSLNLNGLPYIAAQSPKKVDTADAQRAGSFYGSPNLFERFVVSAQQNNCFVVDLTQRSELTRDGHHYYPSPDLGEQQVDLRHKTKDNESGIQMIHRRSTPRVQKEVTVNGQRSRETVIEEVKYDLKLSNGSDFGAIDRIHFLNWKDHFDTELSDMHMLVDTMEKKRESTGKTPMIHCRAGVGRTGTVIVASQLYRLMKDKKLTKDNYYSIITDLINQGRYTRGKSFVQKPAQFISVVRYAEALLTKKITI